jgi:ubiquinone/menaquinone biosynthesis C-methylase UbiE
VGDMEITLIYRSKLIISAYEGYLLPSDKVLDIGCGNGVVTDELRRRFGCAVTGTDILDYRKRDFPFKKMEDPLKLPFSDGEFDVSMLNDALHHCDDQRKILNEALRVSRSVLLFEMEPTLSAKIVEVLINQIHNPAMNIPFNIRTFGEWQRLFNDMGIRFESRRVKRPSILYPFVNFVFRLSSGKAAA